MRSVRLLVLVLIVLLPWVRVSPVVAQEATPVPAAAVAQTDWPMYRGDAARSGSMPGVGPLDTPVELWRYAAAGPIASAPAVVDGTLYVGCECNSLLAIDAATGSEVWSFAASSSVDSSPAVADGIVYAGSSDGILYAVDATDGHELWTFPGARADGAPVVAEGVVYTGSGDGELFALDASTGNELWQAPLGDSASRSPAVADGVAYIGSADGVLHALDAQTGEEQWTFTADVDGVLSTTAVVDDTVYQAIIDSDDAQFYALDAATGTERWRFSVAGAGGFYPPSIGDGLVITTSANGSIYALDPASGTERWHFDTEDEVNAAPALVGDVLYVASHDRNVYALDATTGEELWRFAIDAGADYGPVVVDSVAYLGTSFGTVYAIGSADEAATGSGSSSATPVASPAPVTASPVAATADGDAVTLLWETAGGPTPLHFPSDVAVGPDGTIWVVDSANNQFQIFSADGTFLEAWGSGGDGDGEFNFVRDGDPSNAVGSLAFALDGSFYVADTANRRIQQFALDRRFLTAWGTFGGGDGQFVDPIGVAVDSTGNVFVVDDARDDIQKFSADGQFLTRFGGHGTASGQLAFTGGIAVDLDGNIWIADFDNNRVQQFSGDGEFLQAFGSLGSADGQLDHPVDLAVSPAGDVFVSDAGNARVQVFDPTGQVVTRWEGMIFPGGIGIDAHGHAYVSDVDGGRLRAYSLSGRSTPTTGSAAVQPASLTSPVEVVWTQEGGDGGFDNPSSMTIDPQGHLWIADNGHDRFQIFDTDGTFLESWGESGKGEGQFSLRRSNGDGYGVVAFAPDGSFYVLDPGNRRVQKFDADQNFVLSWGGFGPGPGTFIDPVGLAVDASGVVYVVDDERDVIEKYDEQGTVIGSFDVHPDRNGGFNQINSIAVDQAGNVYVSDIPGFQVLKFAPDGTLEMRFGEKGDGIGQFKGQPLDMAIDADGRLFVTETPEGGRVHVFDAAGAPLAAWGEAGEFPLGVELDGSGSLYLTDYDANTLQQLRLLPPLAP